MPYVFKTNDLDHLPVAGEQLVLESRHNFVRGEFALSDRIYIFADDDTALGKVGGLVAKGNLTEAQPNGKIVALTICFDGVPVSTAITNRSLDRFAHPNRYDLPELNNPSIESMFQIFRNIAEIRRNTTEQPIHPLSTEAADWLDFYHFEKAKT